MACRADGAPLFEIRKRSEIPAATSTAVIYATGAWTFQPIDQDGRLGVLATGCLDKRTINSMHELIDESPWKTTFLRFACMAYSPSFTEYYVHGRREYTARLCSTERLDEKSAGALSIIERELAKVLPKQNSGA